MDNTPSVGARRPAARIAGVSVFAVVLAACTALFPPTSTTFQVTVKDDTGRRTVTVVDTTGLVAEASPGGHAGLSVGDAGVAVANVDDDVRALGVAWIGLSCEERPTIRVTGTDPVVVTVDRGSKPDACDTEGQGYKVTLQLTRPVPAGSVAARVVGQQQR